jgi:hypothetical protein
MEWIGGVGAAPVHLIGGRYRVERILGQGGMAVVYEALDTSTGQRRAIKCLVASDDPRKQQRSTELFEREFHVLSQLAHPRIVSVFDYGVEGTTPHYTMELLDGGDLQQLAPIEWRKACKLARDVCSALAVLHSRRMVYRDLSPRNVRCTADGQAKLIDFGAMAPMGPSKQVVGTAAFCAPELVHLQAVDARTDLYSLGATLYFTLVGRRAYPARDFRQLRDLWRSTPRRPSEIVPAIPAALDRLVTELMQLDPSLRPASAAEIMERLSAIAELPVDEQVLVSQAYLTTPTLVGRDKQLARVRRKMLRALRGRGGAVMIQGHSGVGRSRFLDACVLEAKLAGSTVLRADGGDAQSGDYGVARALAVQLLEALPERAVEAALPRLAILGHVVPELLEKFPNVTLEIHADPQQARPLVQTALREWLWEVSRKRPLMLAVDDVHRADEPSAAFLALLAYEASDHAVLFAVTEESGPGRPVPALKLLADASARLALENLSAEHTEKLLRSVFGDVPNLQLVANRVHALAEGNPSNVMRLAQHLVDKRIVRYESGAWSLPNRIDSGDLASSMTQALRARIEALSSSARELAAAMALCPERRLRFEECLVLTEHRQPGRLMQDLDELLMADVLRIAGERYEIGQQAWVAALRSDSVDQRRLHLRLAEMFEAHAGDSFRVAQHLLRGGEQARGLGVFVEHAELSQQQTDQSPDAFFALIQSLPADWYASYEEGLRLCESAGRARKHAYALRSRLAGLLAITGIDDTTHSLSLINQLYEECGLGIYASLDPALEPAARLQRTFELVQERDAKRSEHDKVLEPLAAIRQLARAMLQVLSVIATSHDLSFLTSLPSLQPYVPLSPALGVVDQLVRGLHARLTARSEQAREIYDALLARMAQPDRAGLDESHHRYSSFGVMSGLGMLEASMGLGVALERAAQIESDPMSRVNAMFIRMLYHLWQGQADEADRCKLQVELLRMQHSPRQWFEGAHLLGEVTAHAAAGDLTRVKQTLDDIAAMAKRWPGWIPIHQFARGEYHRIRGDHPSALEHFETALGLTGPGRHQIWPDLVGAKLRSLVELGRHQEATRLGCEYLSAASAAGLGYVCNHIRMPLALAQARIGQHEAAVANADAVIKSLEQLGSTGLNLGLAYETRARVASAIQDKEGFESAAAKCAGQFAKAENRTLMARYATLVREAKQASVEVSPAVSDAAMIESAHMRSAMASQITLMLRTCNTPKERAQRMLDLLVQQSGVREGFLYGIAGHAPVIAARVGRDEPPVSIDAAAREYLFLEITEQDVTKSGEELLSSDPTAEWIGERGERYRPIPLCHPTDDGFAVVGLALLVIEPGTSFVYPAQLASELSRFAFDSGDVSVFMAPLD